jgi:hypothetical protein
MGLILRSGPKDRVSKDGRYIPDLKRILRDALASRALLRIRYHARQA